MTTTHDIELKEDHIIETRKLSQGGHQMSKSTKHRTLKRRLFSRKFDLILHTQDVRLNITTPQDVRTGGIII